MKDFEPEDFLRAARTFHASGMLEGEAFRDAPETKRYQEAWTTALASHDRWKDIVSRLRPKLPDASIGDTTAPYATAARRCCIYMTRFEDAKQTQPYSIIVGLASVLVPFYHIYRIEADVRGGAVVRGPPLPRPRGGVEGIVSDVLAKHLELELGLKEFPPECEAISVSGIVVGDLLPGQATLLDALFAGDRGNVP